MTEYGKHGKPRSPLSTLVCCVQRRDDRLRFGGEAVPTRGQRLLSLSLKIGRRPSLLTPWRIGGLLSLHVQGQHEE